MSLIDREALIAEYDRVHVGPPGGARKLMVDAPEVRPEPRWIPVTERLPEEDGTYIVCLEDGSVFEYGYITNWYDDAWEYCKKDIVAWMPRPEPYREEEQNATD